MTVVVERSLDLTPDSFEEVFRFEGATGFLDLAPDFQLFFSGESENGENITTIGLAEPVNSSTPQAFYRLKAIFSLTEQ